jgi:hypothetical protein
VFYLELEVWELELEVGVSQSALCARTRQTLESPPGRLLEQKGSGVHFIFVCEHVMLYMI